MRPTANPTRASSLVRWLGAVGGSAVRCGRFYADPTSLELATLSDLVARQC